MLYLKLILYIFAPQFLKKKVKREKKYKMCKK